MWSWLSNITNFLNRLRAMASKTKQATLGNNLSVQQSGASKVSPSKTTPTKPTTPKSTTPKRLLKPTEEVVDAANEDATVKRKKVQCICLYLLLSLHISYYGQI